MLRNTSMRPPLIAREHLDGVAGGVQFGNRSLHDHAALAYDGGPIADQFHFVQQVRGEEDGRSLAPQLADELADVLHALRVEAAGGLVEDDEVGTVDEGQGDPQTLAHAVGVTAHLRPGPLRQAHHLEDFGYALLADLAVHAHPACAGCAARSCWRRRSGRLRSRPRAAGPPDAPRAPGGRAPARSRWWDR